MSKNRVTHFEIPADDPERLMNFFVKVFEWKFERFGESNYWFAITGESGHGINGGIIKRGGESQHVNNSIQVEDIDATIETITQNGGVIKVPKVPVEGHGWLCYFEDTDGNLHTLWQDDSNAA